MTECNAILQSGVNETPEKFPIPKYRILSTIVIYNYFCLKMGCFQAFFGREKGVMKNCPNCGLNDQVVAKFE